MPGAGFEIVAPESSGNGFEITPPPSKISMPAGLPGVPAPPKVDMKPMSLGDVITPRTAATGAENDGSELSPAEREQFQRDVQAGIDKGQRKPAWKTAIGVAAEAATNPSLSTGGPSTEGGKGAQVQRSVKQLQTPGERATGALGLAEAGTEALTPLMGPAAIENPISIAKGLAEGTAASYGAGKISEKAGANEEQQELIKSLAFWAPGVARSIFQPKVGVSSSPEGKSATVTMRGAGAGVALTPEEIVLRGGIAGHQGEVRIPRGPQPAPALEPQTIEGHLAHPDEAAQAMSAIQREGQQAVRVASGLPPVEPPPPVAPPPAPPQVGMDEIAKMGDALSKLPPEVRSQAIIEAHGKLSAILLQQGKVVNPHDGKLTIVTKPEQADKLASDFINSEVERRDKLAEEQQKAQTEAAKPTGKSVRKSQIAVEKPVEAADKFEIAAPAEVESANASDIAEVKPGTVVQQPNSESAGVRPTASGTESASEAAKAKLSPNAEPTPPRFVKGDRVSLADGSEATIHYSSPAMRLVRLVTEDGRRLTVSGKDVTNLKPVAEKPAQAQVAAPEPKAVAAAPESSKSIHEMLAPGFKTEGEKLAEAAKAIPRQEMPRGERRKLPRTAEETQTQELFGKARKELGEDASSDQIMARVDELKKSAPVEEKKFKHRSTQVNIADDSEAAKALTTARARIPDSDLAGKGKETESHVTVRWGLKAADDADLSKLKSYLSSLSPFEATLGKTAKFPPSESSDKAAVIQAPIEAPELHKINEDISKHGEFAERTFDYSPHATVAYVKPDKADRYVGMTVTHGKKFQVNSIAITDRAGKQEEVPLKGSANLTEAPAKSETKPEKSVGPAPGEVGRMKVSDLKLAPARFQYKLGTDAEGVSSLLKDTTKFNPNLANTISVWKDPEDEKFYVVNGHHRYELAKRTGQKEIDVRHIQASDATHARAIGAMQNIAEGRGTAVDAAKFFRDSGIKIEDLEKEGISLGEATAKNGLALSRLDQPIFNKVVSGDLRVGRGVAIGEATSDAAEQKAILNLVERREARGQKISDGQLSELVRFVKEAGKEQETTADLFGSQQITKSLALEKSEVSDYIKTQLAKDRKLFGFVAKEGRAGELARGENVINVEKSKEISTGAQQAEEVYNRLSSRGGDIASILDEAAGKIAESDSERSRAEIKRQAYERVRDAVSRTLGSGQEGSPQRSEGTPQTARETESRSVQDKSTTEQRPPVSGPASSEYEALKAKVAALEKPAPSSFHATAEKLRKAEGPRIAERLRTVADGMEKQIDDKRREMTQNPTPKRMKEYRSRLHDATNMERVQKAMRTLADAHESGEVPRELSALRSKDDIHRLVYQGLDGGGYYDVIPSRERYANKSPEAKKLQEMMDKQSTETSEAKAAKEKASQISQLEAQVQFQKLPGYFPTPKAVISRLLDISFIEPGMKVLEPSAGKGDIAEQIRQQYPEAKLDVVEQQSKLRQILELKGFHVVGEDFLEHKGEYDRIIMNPPFEKGADVEHVRRAYDLLKPGGRLVAVMSPHAEFANDKKSQDFREWLDDHGGNTEKLPEASFKESGTGVASRRVVIDKPEAKDTADKSVALFSNEAENPAPIFYSKAARVAFDKVTNNAPGSSILATLKNNGVKPEEIKWLGLDDFLQGKFRVAKKDLLSHILHNLMQVSEVTKGRRTGEQQEEIDKAKSRRDVSEGKFREIATKEIAEKLNDALAGHTAERAAESAKILADEILTSSRSSAEILYDRFRQRRVLDTILRQDFGTDWGSANESQRKQAIALQAKEIDGRAPSDELLEAGRNLFNDNQQLRVARKENQLPTKYESYTLPGPKENYTELLLTLPELKGRAKFDPSKVEIRRDQRSVTQGSTAIYYDGKHLASYGDDPILQTDGSYKQRPESYWMGVAKDVFTAGDPRNSVQSLAGGFRSGHFEEPNILTHVRFDDRTDADGKKVLFVEEVQSDWHQKGKKQGYSQPIDSSKWTTEKVTGESKVPPYEKWITEQPWFISGTLSDKTSPRAHELYAEYKERADSWLTKSFIVRDAEGKVLGTRYADTANAALEEQRQIETEAQNRNKVPDAPFKTDWHELAMKRMLRYAAEHGYERLGWVTGQQTADRYDLSKHIDGVEWNEKTGDFYASKDNSAVITRHTVSAEDLPELIGKDVARKLIEQEPHKANGNRIVKGLDLKAGGEWAKRLYDQAIPNFLNKVGKKWGSKVAETQIPTGVDQSSELRIAANNALRNFGPHHRQYLELLERANAAGETYKDTVHSVDITPAMARSVIYEGQPLFQNDPYALIRDRAPEAWAHIASNATAKPVHESGLKPYVEMNSEGLQLVGRAIRRPFLGASIPPRQVPEIFSGFDDIFKKIKKTSPEAAANLEQIKQAIKGAVDKDSGVTITPKRDLFNTQHDLRILHEELFHAEVQHGPGKGVLARGVPTEMINDPGIRQMVTRIENETGRSEESLPEVIIAEAMADIVTGTPHELKPELAEKTATKYYEAVGEMHGVGTLEKAQAIQDLVDEKARTLGLTKEGEGFHEKYNQPARTALRTVLEKYRAKDAAGRQQPGTGEVARREGERATGSLSPRNDSLNVVPGKGAGSGEPGAAGALASTAPVGLTDEELAEWSKSRGFRTEPAGEQLGMFGQNEPVHRVYRLGGKGKEQVGLAYQSQLDKLNQPKAEPTEPFALTGDEAQRDDQPRLFGAGDMGEIIGTPQEKSTFRPKTESGNGSLFHSDKGTFEPGKIKSYIDANLKELRGARELERGMFDLEKRHEARVLRAVQTLEAANKANGGKEALKDYEQIYHHLEDPDTALTDKQDKILDDTVLPIMEQNDEFYQELTEDGVPMENYVHRQVKGKGGWFDRILSGVKGTGKGNLLSKSAPQTKGRTMMALEYVGQGDNPQRSLMHKPGERMVISIKGGQVTAWKNGQPENLGGISHSEEGKVFEDKDGSIWRLTQATTKEIEQHTELEYYHNALASALVSNLQLAKAVEAMHFVEAFKQSDEFSEIAHPEGAGTPPKGWRITQLPQFKGYYFEPHYADVLDRYAQRLQTSPSALDQVGSLMRVAMLLNPIMHPLNVAASWAVDRGATGFLPHTWWGAAKAGMKAVKAVGSQNDDFLASLDEGAPLQSHREATQQITKLFFDQLGEGLTKEEPWALKVAKNLGMAPVTLIKALHKFSSKVAWLSSDIMFLQAAYERQAKGMDFSEALRETGRTIPEYRIPAHIMNSRTVSKIMESKWATIFGAYHYGLLKSFAEVGKSALGLNEHPAGGDRTKDVLKGWDRLALIGLVAMALYPLLDELAKKLTGDEHARAKRVGPFAVIDAWDQSRKGNKSVTEALQTSVTPAPQTKAIAEMASNREFYSGRQIFNPHDDWQTQAHQLYRYLVSQAGQIGQASKAAESESGKRKFAWQQAGVQFKPSRAEKVAQDIAHSKMGTEAPEPGESEMYGERHDILDALRKGDNGPLERAEDKGNISPAQAKRLRHRATLTTLEDTVNNFSYAETMKVRDAAEKDGSQEEIEQLDRMLARKRRNMWARHEPVPELAE